MNIQGQAALVTGGGSGLGEATARELARLGGKVAVLDVNLANAQKVAAEIAKEFGDGCAVACQCDITDSASLQAAIDAAAAAHGPARILMHIAGIGAARRTDNRRFGAATLRRAAKHGFQSLLLHTAGLRARLTGTRRVHREIGRDHQRRLPRNREFIGTVAVEQTRRTARR